MSSRESKLHGKMQNIVLIIHLVIVVSMILAILIQRTNTDGLSGLGGGSSSGNALFSVRGKANILTKITSFLAIGFLTTSLTLAYMANHRASHSLVDKIITEKSKVSEKDFEGPKASKETPATAPAPAKPAAPEVPLAK